LARLFAVAFDARRSASNASGVYPLARSGRFVDVSLAEMAVQYVSSGKRDTTDVTRMVWVIVVVVSVAGQCSPGFVGLAANGALVHSSDLDFEASGVVGGGHRAIEYVRARCRMGNRDVGGCDIVYGVGYWSALGNWITANLGHKNGSLAWPDDHGSIEISERG
jgi:hypothetical protein